MELPCRREPHYHRGCLQIITRRRCLSTPSISTTSYSPCSSGTMILRIGPTFIRSKSPMNRAPIGYTPWDLSSLGGVYRTRGFRFSRTKVSSTLRSLTGFSRCIGVIPFSTFSKGSWGDLKNVFYARERRLNYEVL